MFCGKCGSEIEATDKFCPFCGAPAEKPKTIEEVNREAAASAPVSRRAGGYAVSPESPKKAKRQLSKKGKIIIGCCAGLVLLAGIGIVLALTLGMKSDAAAAVDALIDEIGEVTLDSEAAILKAEGAAAALLEEDYAQLDGLEKLSEAKKRYNELVLENEAAQADALILAIGEVTLQSKTAIEEAESAERKLSDGARPFLKNIQLLVDARKKYDELLAAGIDNLIAAIGTVSLTSGNAIKVARDAYNGQTQAIRDRVTGLAVLEAAERKYQKLLEQKEIKNADAVIAAIAAIGEVAFYSKEDIKYARDLYNALTWSEKERVGNKNEGILRNAEETFVALMQAERTRQIEELKKELTIKYNKKREITWYEPKAMPKYIDTRSYVLPYIAVWDDGDICLISRYSYTSGYNNWIFWHKLTFFIDGEW